MKREAFNNPSCRFCKRYWRSPNTTDIKKHERLCTKNPEAKISNHSVNGVPGTVSRRESYLAKLERTNRITEALKPQGSEEER